MPLHPALTPLIRLSLGGVILAGCLFETSRPRTVPLRTDADFARFDPLLVTFLDTSGNTQDTLYRGPGDAEGEWNRLVTDGLPDSGWVRLEGFAGGELAYRLDIPWPADTLFASPRWTPVGEPIYPDNLEFVSLAFRQGTTYRPCPDLQSGHGGIRRQVLAMG